MPRRWIVVVALASAARAFLAKGFTDSEGLISAFILSSHCRTPTLEHAWGHVAVASLAFLVRKFTLAFQKIGNFLGRLVTDLIPCLVDAALFNNRQMPGERRIGGAGNAAK